MFRKCLAILTTFLLVLCCLSCSSTEEAVVEETPVEEAPAITPGEMVLIPAGEFIFGTDDKEPEPALRANPQQTIDLPAFYIDKYEVTFKEFLDFCIEHEYTSEGSAEGKNWQQFFSADKRNNPVSYITWGDAKAYCEANGKRLPTEVEWEKAARGTDGRRFPWGDQWIPNQSNTYEAGYKQPVDIGQFDKDVSPYGVHDMLGNVLEWTESWFKPYEGNRLRDENFGERFKVLRGACSRFYGSRTHLWARNAYLPNYLADFGFRCAKDASEVESAPGR
jgi:formylglycine-generating enzyme required for sulfatase activity